MRERCTAWMLIGLWAALAACAAEPERVEDDTDAPALLSAPQDGVTPVRAERPGSLMTGLLASGSGEDLLLANEQGRYLIERNQDAPAQEAPSPDAWIVPGAVIDAVATTGGDDALIALTPLVGGADGAMVRVAASDVRASEGSQGGAVVSQARVAVPGGELEVTTRAVLTRDLPHLVLHTTVKNVGKQAVEARLGDRLVFGPGALFTSGGPRDLPGPVQTTWLGHEALPEAFGYTLDGTTTFTAELHVAQHGTRASVTAVDAVGLRRRLAPGEEAVLVRRFWSTGRGMADVRAWLADLTGAPVGTVYGKLTAPRGLDPASFRVALRQGDTLLGHLPISSSLAVDARLPAGSYQVTLEGPWGLAAAPQTLVVPRGGSARLEANLGTLTPISVKVHRPKSSEPTPATLVVTDANRRPVQLGLTGRGSAGGPLLYLPTGEGQLWLPPGSYKVLATRGPAYTLGAADLEVPEVNPDKLNKPVALDLTLERKLDADGFLIADLRVYPRGDHAGFASAEEHADALLAAGVELAAFTPRRVAANPEDTAKQRSLTGLRGLPGQEVIGLDPDLGTFTVLPANTSPNPPLPPLSSRQPEALFDDIRRLGANKEPLLTAVWPRTPARSGYFDRYKLDRDSGTFTTPGASAELDAIEVLSGGALGNPCLFGDPGRCSGGQKALAIAVDDGLLDWEALTTQGRRITATAASGSRAVGLEPVGVPFTWIEVGGRKTDPASVDLRDALDALTGNRAVPSTGPLIRFTAEGRGPGNLVPGLKRVRRGDKTIIIRGARIDITVEAISWAAFDEVVLYQDGQPIERWEIEPAIKDGVQRFTTTLTVKPEEDRWYYVRATGKRLLPTLPHLPTRPFAMSNPIWVDGDGDGRWEHKPPIDLTPKLE